MIDDPTPIPGTPEANDLVVRGADGDPLPHPTGVRMVEKESYERVIEGLRMTADACMHLAKMEPAEAETWKGIGQLMDRLRLEACKLARTDLSMKQLETPEMRGAPVNWRVARNRFLDGVRQATGGMRQLASCFRGDYTWSFMAQQLERKEQIFRALLVGSKPQAKGSGLILPPGFARH